jgi:hypothetical protein
MRLAHLLNPAAQLRSILRMTDLPFPDLVRHRVIVRSSPSRQRITPFDFAQGLRQQRCRQQ